MLMNKPRSVYFLKVCSTNESGQTNFFWETSGDEHRTNLFSLFKSNVCLCIDEHTSSLFIFQNWVQRTNFKKYFETNDEQIFFQCEKRKNFEKKVVTNKPH